MTLQEFFARPGSWCQHALRKTVGGVIRQCCLEGALIECYGDHTTPMMIARNRVQEAIIKVGTNPERYPWSLPAFNDARGRTIEDIRALVAEAGV